MPISGIAQGLGIGGAATATISGAPGGGGGEASGFNIDVRDTEANILARTGDATGVIAYGTDTEDLYVYDGTVWNIYNNS